ncbi:MAG: HAD-IB family hydrolase [Spirochaetaceae bacterium]|jgi:HAD superfamily hydrolase (TIGR01490 family)|nr:HAD-IB family hydrolase [Spirochaetaceae bacterium]
MGIHIFDVDYTIIRKTTAHYFIPEALAAGVIKAWQLRSLAFAWLRYKMGWADQNFIAQSVRYLSGIDQKTLDSLAEAAFTKRMQAQVYTQARQLIENLQQNGEPVYLATSSLYPLIQPLERFLKVKDSLATVLEFADGKATGRLIDSAPFGCTKKTMVEAWLTSRNYKPSEVNFYSDSYTDMPLLQWCGHPVAVNPDSRLAREAARRAWTILHFSV